MAVMKEAVCDTCALPGKIKGLGMCSKCYDKAYNRRKKAARAEVVLPPPPAPPVAQYTEPRHLVVDFTQFSEMFSGMLKLAEPYLTPAVRDFRHVQQQGLEIFIRKNADYGNSFAEDGVTGVMIRMKDKINRYLTLARQNGEGAVKDESLRDTLIDLHNYAAMAIMCLDGTASPAPPVPEGQR